MSNGGYYEEVIKIKDIKVNLSYIIYIIDRRRSKQILHKRRFKRYRKNKLHIQKGFFNSEMRSNITRLIN